MHTSALLLRQVRRTLVVAFLLGGFSALLQLALPLAALHAFDTALPSRSLETLMLLCAVTFAAMLALVCLNAARARMLLRAGLWLDHTLGAHALETGLRDNAEPNAMARDAAAMRQLRKSLSDGGMLAVLDVPWLLVLSGAFALLDWRLAAIACAALGLLCLRAVVGYRSASDLARRSGAAAQRVDAWWQSVTRMTGLDRLPGNAAQQWERLNREHVAAAYGLGVRLSGLGEFSHLVRASAQACMFAAGIWLAMAGEITTGLLVAAMLLLWRLFEPIERLVPALPDLAATREAWQHLSAIGPAVTSERDADPRSLPTLQIGGPLAVGLGAVATFLAIGAAVAALTPAGQIAVLAGSTLFETQVTSVYPTRAGISARVLVSEGSHVETGDLIATLDTRALDSRISMLKLKASKAQIELRALNDEAAALVAPGAPPLRNRAPLEKLEARIADVGRQGRELADSLAQTEQELARSRILSPASGRVVGLTARAGMPLDVDTPVATIVASGGSLFGRLLSPFAANAHREAREPASAPQHVAAAFKSGS